jgi:hypothetical protein
LIGVSNTITPTIIIKLVVESIRNHAVSTLLILCLATIASLCALCLRAPLAAASALKQ